MSPDLELDDEVAAARRLSAFADVEAARLVEEAVHVDQLFVAVDDGAGRGGLVGGVELAEGVRVRRGAVAAGIAEEAIAKRVERVAGGGGGGEGRGLEGKEELRGGDTEVGGAYGEPPAGAFLALGDEVGGGAVSDGALGVVGIVRAPRVNRCGLVAW